MASNESDGTVSLDAALRYAAPAKPLSEMLGGAAPNWSAKPEPTCDRCGNPKSQHTDVQLFCPFYSTFRERATTPATEGRSEPLVVTDAHVDAMYDSLVSFVAEADFRIDPEGRRTPAHPGRPNRDEIRDGLAKVFALLTPEPTHGA